MLNPAIEYDDYDVVNFWKGNGKTPVDRWGNPYVLIELDRIGPLGSESAFHIYSLGADGNSKSAGNASEDINSWDDDRGRFYENQIEWTEAKYRLRRSIWLAPIIWGVFLFMSRWLRQPNGT